jgi:hypothetical protein
VLETRLHERTRLGIERLAWRAQHLVDNRWREGFVPSSEFRVPSFALEPFLATLFTLACRAGRAAAVAFALQ